MINVFFVVFRMFMFISWRASQIERWQSMAFVLTGPCGPSLCRFTHTAELIFLCALYLDYPYLCLWMYLYLCLHWRALMAIECRPAHFQSPQFHAFFLIIAAGNADHESLWRGFNCAIKVITASPCLAKPISISYRSQQQNCPRDLKWGKLAIGKYAIAADWCQINYHWISFWYWKLNSNLK